MAKKPKYKVEDGKTYELVFRPYIVKNGKKIYPKKARVFAFWVQVSDAA